MLPGDCRKTVAVGQNCRSTSSSPALQNDAGCLRATCALGKDDRDKTSGTPEAAEPDKQRGESKFSPRAAARTLGTQRSAVALRPDSASAHSSCACLLQAPVARGEHLLAPNFSMRFRRVDVFPACADRLAWCGCGSSTRDECRQCGELVAASAVTCETPYLGWIPSFIDRVLVLSIEPDPAMLRAPAAEPRGRGPNRLEKTPGVQRPCLSLSSQAHFHPARQGISPAPQRRPGVPPRCHFKGRFMQLFPDRPDVGRMSACFRVRPAMRWCHSPIGGASPIRSPPNHRPIV